MRSLVLPLPTVETTPISETELNLDLEKKYIDKFKTLIEVSELDMELKID